MIRFFLGVLTADGRGAMRDPIVPLFAVIPFLATGAVYFGLPPLLDYLAALFTGLEGANLLKIRQTVHLFILLTPPLMLGTVYGFFALDDRDDGISEVLSASPVSPGMLLGLRLLLPGLLSLGYGLLLSLLLPLPAAPPGRWFATLLLVALEAPLMTLIIASLAENKVEGLAVSKASSLLFVGALIGLLLPEPRAYLGAISPQYWVVVPLLRGVGELPAYGSLAIGMGYHLLLITLLTRRYTR